MQMINVLYSLVMSTCRDDQAQHNASQLLLFEERTASAQCAHQRLMMRLQLDLNGLDPESRTPSCGMTALAESFLELENMVFECLVHMRTAQ